MLTTSTIFKQMKASERSKNIIALIILVVVSLIVFRGVFKGKVITNSDYLYNFEPWSHYINKPKSLEDNFILSDLMDGTYAPAYHMLNELKSGKISLWNYSDKLGSIGFFNILNGLLNFPRTILWFIFGIPIGWTLEVLLRFTIGGFFMYLLLKEMKVNFFIALSVAIGFTFGSSNISQYQGPFGNVSLIAPIAYYFVLRIINHNKWIDSLGLIVASIFLINATFVSVSFYFSFWLAIFTLYLLFRHSHNKDVLIKLITSLLFVIFINLLPLISTTEFFNTGISLSYRDNYGLTQLQPTSALNLFSANIFGHPLKQKSYWNYGSYVNTSIFTGLLTAISIFTFSIIRLIKKRDTYSIFFFLAIIFLFLDIYHFPFESFEQLTNSLPIFHGNSPTYQKTVLQMFISIFGALGLQYLWMNNFSKKMKRTVFLFILTCLIFLITWFYQYYLSINHTDYMNKYFHANVAGAIFGYITLLMIGNKKNVNSILQTLIKNYKKNYFNKNLSMIIIGTLMLGVFVFEAIVNSDDWIAYSNTSSWYQETEITNYLKNNIGPGRIISLGRVAIPSMMSAYGIPVAAGRLSVPEPYKLMLQAADSQVYSIHPTQTFFDVCNTDLTNEIWDLVDVRYFITSKHYDLNCIEKYGESIKVIDFNDGKLLKSLTEPQHAYFVDDGIVFDNYEDMVAQFNSERWSVRKNIAFMNSKYLLPMDSPTYDDDNTHSGLNAPIDFIQQSNHIQADVQVTDI